MTGKNKSKDNNFTLMSLLPSVAMAKVSADSNKAAEIFGLKSKDDVLKTQSGRSMIEMLGVLAIIGVLSVGGIAGYSKAMMKYKINKTVDQVSQIVGNIRTLYASQKNYNNLGSWTAEGRSALRKAHIIPEEMWNGSGSSGSFFGNAFGGNLTINAAEKKNADSSYKAFTVELDGIPEEACMELLTYDWGSGSSSGLIAIGATWISTVYQDCNGDSSQGIACPNGDQVSVPMPVSTAATACKAGDNNYIGWKFY